MLFPTNALMLGIKLAANYGYEFVGYNWPGIIFYN